MLGFLWEKLKGFFSGKGGGTAIGYDNKNQSGTTTGDNSPALNAGRDLILNAPLLTPAPPKPREQELVEWVRQHGYDRPLSQVLLCALEFAQLVGANDFEKWLNLEIHGYEAKGGMTEKDVVPEYREIRITYMTRSRHTWNADCKDPDWSLVNSYRIRDSVTVLESLAATNEPISYTNENVLNMVREYFRVDVIGFFLSHVDVQGLLTTIRTKMLGQFNKQVAALPSKSPNKSLT